MLGSALQFGGIKGEDRFYIPVKARKIHNQQKLSRRPKADETESPSSDIKSEVEIPAKKPSQPLTRPKSNLERFIDAITPSVPAQYFSKKTMRGWRTCDIEFQPYFILNDLWESFKEWSAYGAGVPLVLDGNDSVVQYYVPYLSGIQLYGESATSLDSKSRLAGEYSDVDSCRDTSSDETRTDFKVGKTGKLSTEPCARHHLASKDTLRMRNLSGSDEQSTTSDDGDVGNPQSGLLFQFFEQDLPYLREPLADKISDLAYRFPGLKTLRSCDVLPASWISVAWYPIYRIPTGPTLKDLDACFLTYHSLSTPIGGYRHSQAPVMIYPNDMDGVSKICLPIFGMASYKLKGSIWSQNGSNKQQTESSLLQAADNWLRLLQVNQPDYKFFASHRTYWR